MRGKVLKEKEERKSVSVSRAKGLNALSLAGFSTNFPAALRITRFTVTNEREGRGVGASRDFVVRA